MNDERTCFDTPDAFANVFLDVGKRLEGEERLEPYVFGDLMPYGVVGEGYHAAVGVMDEDHFLRAQEPL